MASASSDRHATGFVMAEDDRTAVTVIGPGENATYYGDDAGVASVYFMALIGLSHEVWISYLHTLALVGVENVGAMNFAPAAKSLLTPHARPADRVRPRRRRGRLSPHRRSLQHPRGIDGRPHRYLAGA